MHIKYIAGAICIGLVILLIFILSLPDHALHITACDVGQGDAMYIVFPDGRDMLIDGGPDSAVLSCLGRHMPFWDRSIDMVVLTHPELDHFGGLLHVFSRFKVNAFLTTYVGHTSVEYKRLQNILLQKNIPVTHLDSLDKIEIGEVLVNVLWPTYEFQDIVSSQLAQNTSTDWKRNDTSLVLQLTYGSFDLLATGDADAHTQADYIHSLLANRQIEVLKVPHHGAKDALSIEFIEHVHPQMAILSSGMNRQLNHPAQETLDMLTSLSIRSLQTKESGDISITSDGHSWSLTP